MPPVASLASPLKRLVAHILDFFIPFCALLAVVGVSALAHTGIIIGVAFVAYVIWALMLFSRGTTPGKNLLGMTVVYEDGRPASFLTMLIRETIGKFISGLFLCLGFIWILIDENNQGFHDKLVGTYVVDR